MRAKRHPPPPSTARSTLAAERDAQIAAAVRELPRASNQRVAELANTSATMVQRWRKKQRWCRNRNSLPGFHFSGGTGNSSQSRRQHGQVSSRAHAHC